MDIGKSQNDKFVAIGNAELGLFDTVWMLLLDGLPEAFGISMLLSPHSFPNFHRESNPNQ
jgi:hypothetical protein